MSQQDEQVYSDETTIVVQVIVAIQSIVRIVVEEQHAAPAVALPRTLSLPLQLQKSC